MENTLKNADYVWVKVTEKATFPARDGAGALVYDNKMWLIGGWNPGDKKTFPIHSSCNNEVWNSDDGVTWSLVKPNTHLDDSFDPTTDWEARHTAGYVIHQNKIWIIGGQTLPQFAPADEVFYHDVWNTEDGINWNKIEMIEPFTPRRGMIGGNAIFKDRVWLLGGGTYETPGLPKYVYHNDVWSSADGIIWERHIDQALWYGRVYHDVAIFDDCLWVMEGQRSLGKNMRDIWYSSDGTNWHELPDTPWKERHAASVFVYKDALWIVAGCHMERDVWKLIRKE